jgi:hypothetical protein
MKWLLAWLALLGFLVWEWRSVPIERPVGALVSSVPWQLDLKSQKPIRYGHLWKLTPKACYSLRARVLSKQEYGFHSADLAPMDLAVGWGAMSDTALLDKLKYYQSGRFFYWSFTGTAPVPVDVMKSSCANVHIIPFNDRVKGELRGIREGSLVHLRGMLVVAQHADGKSWTTSLSRTDQGAGACELMLVADVSTLAGPTIENSPLAPR